MQYCAVILVVKLVESHGILRFQACSRSLKNPCSGADKPHFKGLSAPEQGLLMSKKY